VSLLVGCSLAWIAMELMSRWYERRREADATGPRDGSARAARAPGERVRGG
jgi:hypothetical protein